MIRFTKVALFLIVLAGTTVSLGSYGAAAGTLVISAEVAQASVEKGTNNTITFYATNSGAALGGTTFSFTLSNATVVSFDPTGTLFSLNSITAGGTIGSSTGSIFVGYSSASGGSGKQLIGKLLVASAANVTGTATVTTSVVDAFDADLNPMLGNGAMATFAITAPAGSTPVVQTPINPSSTQQPSASPRTAPDQPPAAQVVAPDNNGTPTQYSQEDVNSVLKNESSTSVAEFDNSTDNLTTSKKSNLLVIIISSLVVLTVLTGAVVIIRRMKRKNNMPHVQTIITTNEQDSPFIQQAQQPSVIVPNSNKKQ